MDMEVIDAQRAGAEWYQPGAEIGEDVVPLGHYAIGMSTGSGGVFVVGTPDDLQKWVKQVGLAADNVQAHSLTPLTLIDFAPDEDGNYPCPRCSEEVGPLFEPNGWADLQGMINAITTHITTQHPIVRKEATDGQ